MSKGFVDFQSKQKIEKDFRNMEVTSVKEKGEKSKAQMQKNMEASSVNTVKEK